MLALEAITPLAVLGFLALGAIGCHTSPDQTFFPQNARILFQGDSITDGNRGRNADPNHILGHGYVFAIGAREGCDFPAARLEFLNRGISGNTVHDLAARWKTDTLDLEPDVLSILIGVNDAAQAVQGGGTSVAAFESEYDRLLAATLESLPNVRLVLCEPFILPVGMVKHNPERWGVEMASRREAVARLAAKYHATYVRFQQAFDTACEQAPADYWIWDGVHPTYRGHQLMADIWLATTRESWRRAATRR